MRSAARRLFVRASAAGQLQLGSRVQSWQPFLSEKQHFAAIHSSTSLYAKECVPVLVKICSCSIKSE